MPVHSHPGTLLAVLTAVIGLILAACSSSPAEPAAVSVDECFQRVKALRETQERQSEAIGQRLAGHLSGDETSVGEVLAALEEFLPELFPEFRAVLNETREGLAPAHAIAIADHVRKRSQELLREADEASSCGSGARPHRSGGVVGSLAA